MDNHEDFFSPEAVGEQIEQFLQESVGPEDVQTSAVQVVQMLHDIYQLDPRMQRVRGRLAEQTLTTHNIKELNSAKKVQFSRGIYMQQIDPKRRPRRTGWQLLGLIAACFVSVLIVGSLVIAFTYGRQRTMTTAVHKTETLAKPKAIPTATPTVISFVGKTVYTTPANQVGFNGLSWSPDSQRIATSTINGTQIWDATTGAHLVNVQLPGANEYPYAQDWSPNSQQVAIATNQHVLLVNGLTGQVELSYAGGATAQVDTHAHVAMKSAAGISPLASLLPESGGLGYRATAWSHDGQLMASAVSLGISGEIQVWNTHTGAALFTLTGDSTYNVGSVSWSSDGQYIAANMWNTQSGNLNQPNNQVVVWSVATHQIVFQHKDYLGSSDATVLWQPKSHNIAFEGGTTTAGSNLTTVTLEIWDGVAGTLVKQYVGVGGDALTWSPDGKYLVYGSYTLNKDTGKAYYPIDIMDVTTDKPVVNVYQRNVGRVIMLTWSPDGQYIASAEDGAQGMVTSPGDIPKENAVVNVWAIH